MIQINQQILQELKLVGAPDKIEKARLYSHLVKLY